MALVVLLAIMDDHCLQVILCTDVCIPKQRKMHTVVYFAHALCSWIECKALQMYKQHVWKILELDVNALLHVSRGITKGTPSVVLAKLPLQVIVKETAEIVRGKWQTQVCEGFQFT